MKQFRIYRHPAGAIEAVKQGWSWPAFFFSSIWALFKKMWLLGIVVFVALFALALVLLGSLGEQGTIISNILSIVVSVVFGMNGNAWREKNLLSRGYEMTETVTAANPEGAAALFLKTGAA